MKIENHNDFEDFRSVVALQDKVFVIAIDLFSFNSSFLVRYGGAFYRYAFSLFRFFRFFRFCRLIQLYLTYFKDGIMISEFKKLEIIIEHSGMMQ